MTDTTKLFLKHVYHYGLRLAKQRFKAGIAYKLGMDKAENIMSEVRKELRKEGVNARDYMSSATCPKWLIEGIKG